MIEKRKQKNRAMEEEDELWKDFTHKENHNEGNKPEAQSCDRSTRSAKNIVAPKKQDSSSFLMDEEENNMPPFNKKAKQQD